MATAEGIYGLQNPFRDDSAVQAFRSLPSITARRRIKAHETLLKAYITYYEKKWDEDPQTSTFIHDRCQYFSSEGSSLEDIARSEMTTSIALLSNIMPATFWLVYYIVSDSTVFADCREEASRTLNTGGGLDGEVASYATRSIDADSTRSQCPILLSAFKGVFHYHAVGISSRVLLKDHLLDGQFLLKKDNILLIPGVVQHQERSVWGEDVDQFSLPVSPQSRPNVTKDTHSHSFAGHVVILLSWLQLLAGNHQIVVATLGGCLFGTARPLDAAETHQPSELQPTSTSTSITASDANTGPT
ncbi:hypothetical protein INS49_009608 [Diaporthe citri]|uniref:uncharacterized protein n=1 Tax=Diaporthe citri TaxID=83186 RepID=UPI001C7F93ED|nr:uncharacterized protein INS49_009608 [Diaporthe citri]KAG6361381.1 hypothetical protein INS49_009608 [Diaporthe citri]